MMRLRAFGRPPETADGIPDSRTGTAPALDCESDPGAGALDLSYKPLIL